MENRQQVEDRVKFSSETRKRVLCKSRGKCGHCGKVLESKGNFTIDHAVPLAKGGTSDFENLVALCRECNEIKGDSVIQPRDYYKYLDKVEIDKLENYFNQYCKNMNWITVNNAFATDNISFDVEYAVGSKKMILQKKKVEFRKAVDDDFESICSFLENYQKVYDKDKELFDKGVEHYLNDMWYNSSVYYMKGSSGDITLVIMINPVAIDVTSREDDSVDFISYCFGSTIFLNPSINISNSSYDYLKDYILQCIMFFINKCADFPDLDLIFDAVIFYPYEDSRVSKLLKWYFSDFKDVERFYEYGVFHLECFGEKFSRGRDKALREYYRQNYKKFKTNGQLYLRDVLMSSNRWEKRFESTPCICESEHFCKYTKFAKEHNC